MSTVVSASVQEAIQAFQSGEPVLVHDAADREGETDLMFPAGAVDHRRVAQLRNDAGGLICVAVDAPVAEAFELPLLQHNLDHPATHNHDLAYDDRSSFSITVNHRDTRTGITDRDRAHTIVELARAAAEPAAYEFANSFRSPGHVHLLRAADGLLDERQGHTEFGVFLAREAGSSPAVVVCEMLDDETGHALSPDQARSYAVRHGAPYLEGEKLLATRLYDR